MTPPHNNCQQLQIFLQKLWFWKGQGMVIGYREHIIRNLQRNTPGHELSWAEADADFFSQGRQWYNDHGDVADANADEDIFDQDCQA